MAVLIFERPNGKPLFIDIGELQPFEVIKLAADVGRALTWVATVTGTWRDPPSPLWELFPLSQVSKSNLWQFAAASPDLRGVLLLSWESEVKSADHAWASLIRPKLQRLQEALRKDGARWSRFSLIE